MKILVLSDSHHITGYMLRAVEQIRPDVIIHLGDRISDARKLQSLHPEPEYHMVCGNCDPEAEDDMEQLLTLGGARVFLTHGHRYGVKSGLQMLIDKARRSEADVALFGHTHIALLRQLPGLWLMNPGQMLRHDSEVPASYGVVKIENGEPICGIGYIS